ncbi:dipeptide ABC transporter ATP-binding protein [Ornithinimicrobium faecis]|uniref:dipeptide ABC transporter ATP-binding protein n=1 Tax=Ornithinimicrobium faecis TaxID=2934158 RepID=UPI00211951FC|nr:ABC transporter ATP-binding protein [Ornithinimicrobium sp. HY1745]
MSPTTRHDALGRPETDHTTRPVGPEVATPRARSEENPAPPHVGSEENPATPHVGSEVAAGLLSVRDLHVSYQTSKGIVPALRGVDLDISRGEVVALVGESGSGKSTLGHALIGLLADNAQIDQGSITLSGQDVSGWSENRFRSIRGRDVGLIPQDPTVSLNPVKRIGAQVIGALTAHRRLPRAQARTEAAALLERAGLDQPEQRMRQYPHELSGGMRQRVLIAISIASDPELLIADEPTSALDVTVQRRILDHLETLTRESGTSVLLVTHDLGVAADRADRIVVLNHGLVVEHGPVDEVLSNPQDSYTQRLLAAAPGLGGPTLTRTSAALTSAAQPTAYGIERDTAPLVEVRNLVKEFRLPGARRGGDSVLRAVDDVSFTLHRGRTLALVGESGSGKSTTARLVLRLADPTEGTIAFAGDDITHARGREWRELRRRAQLVYQNPYASLDPRFSVKEVVTEPLRAFGVGDRRSQHETAVRLLDRVALPESTLTRRPAELSGGQRQRVAIARALALNPDLVVCDEAVSALDVSVQAQVLELLVELQEQEDLTYLFITHDLGVVRQIAHEVAVMRSGQLVELAPTHQIFDRPEHPYTRELLGAIAGTRRPTRHDGDAS